MSLNGKDWLFVFIVGFLCGWFIFQGWVKETYDSAFYMYFAVKNFGHLTPFAFVFSGFTHSGVPHLVFNLASLGILWFFLRDVEHSSLLILGLIPVVIVVSNMLTFSVVVLVDLFVEFENGWSGFSLVTYAGFGYVLMNENPFERCGKTREYAGLLTVVTIMILIAKEVIKLLLIGDVPMSGIIHPSSFIVGVSIAYLER